MNPKNIASALVALAAVGLTGWLLLSFRPDADEHAPTSVGSEESTTTSVALSATQQQVAGIESELVTRQTLRITRVLPARFAYDDSQHVAVRAATDGVLESVLVKTGDSVQAGQPIATLSSPSVGAARGEILSREAAVALTTKQLDWETKICEGVQKLAELIRHGQTIESIEQELGDLTLGKYRGQLMTNYSKMKLASKLSDSVQGMGQTGAISGRVIQQRTSDYQQAHAELGASIEQSLFETRQACKRAESAADAARRDLLVARQTLINLIGAPTHAKASGDVSPGSANLSLLTIVSPLSGTVERKAFSATERVTAESVLFIIADTSQLWVEADVRGRDWTTLQVTEGDTVIVTTPAVPDVASEANVYFVGREVDPASGAIPLVVKIDNTEQHFRPGLFARVEVPTSELANVIAVPESAVMDLEGQASVFVVDQGKHVPIAVTVGARSSGQVEIRSGLTEGQEIVVAGAFVLKSELLLEGEE